MFLFQAPCISLVFYLAGPFAGLLVEAATFDDDFPLETGEGISPYVMGGSEARREQVPSIAAFLKLGEPFCAGSLISERVVLSAASCFFYLADGESVNLKLGTTNISGVEGDGVVEMDITNQDVVIHEEYDGYHFDLSLVLLPEKVNLSATLRPVGLPLKRQRFPFSVAFQTGTLAGWGIGYVSGNEMSSEILQVAEARILGPVQCRVNLRAARIPNEAVDNKEICVSNKKNKAGICLVDIGGPLTVQIKGKTVLAGIASRPATYTCNGISIFTYVGAYLDWISEVTEIKIK